MMNRLLSRLGSLAAVAAVVGCMGHAGVHYQDQNGGVLTINGVENKAMQDAHRKMTSHCGPGNYTVVRRERVVVGQEQYAHGNTNYQEDVDRQRDQDTVATSSSVQTAAYETESSGYSETDTEEYYDGSNTQSEYAGGSSGDAYATQDSVATASTSEDEATQTTGNVQTSQVQGTRNVHETRVHYRCGQASARR